MQQKVGAFRHLIQRPDRDDQTKSVNGLIFNDESVGLLILHLSSGSVVNERENDTFIKPESLDYF